jgi:uncharacterized radical SAM superfamily Fe-S cluster-containing enzyme
MDRIFSRTQSLCPVCGKKVDANIIERDNAIYLEKLCPADGTHYAMVSSDAEWYRKSLSFVKPLTQPKSLGTDSFSGCPDSCGLCTVHGQHTCLPVIEITSACDLDCPVCLKKWKAPQQMTLAEFSFVIDKLIAYEGFLPVINLSGGEPTINPELFGMLRSAKRSEIMQVSISTNGLRILNDEKFRSELRAFDPLIALQFDGFVPSTYMKLRGPDLSSDKIRLIELLERDGFRYSLVATIANGINEHEIPAIVDYFFKGNALSLMFQPAAFTGNASTMAHPQPRATIPDVIDSIAKSSFAKKDDFVPLPCSHPSCFALSYYFMADDRHFIALKDLMGVENFLNIISNRTLPGLDNEGFDALRNRVYNLWSAADQFPHTDLILKKMRALVQEMNKSGFTPERAFQIGSSAIKAIFIHQFMDRDSIDIGRLMKCCNHYPQADGRLIPICAQNVFFSQ